MRNIKLKIGFLLCTVLVIGFIVLKNAKADYSEIDGTTYNTDGTLDIINNGHGGMMVNIDNVPAGKRLDDILYCFDNCSSESSWQSAKAYHGSNNEINNVINGYVMAVGNYEMSLGINLPESNDKIYIKTKFVDLEPMNISYGKFNLTANNDNEIDDVYIDGVKDLNNYDEPNTNIVIGYRGGDIILPEGCTQNGCLLKVELTKQNFEALESRFNSDNEHHDEEELIDLSSMFNHLETVKTDSAMLLRDEHDNIVYDETESTKSFYIIVNKYIYENNMFYFNFGEGKHRVLTEDYIGLDYKLPDNRKYFDDKNNFADLSFTEFNHYTATSEIFYGAPRINLIVDHQVPLVLTNPSNYVNIGTLKNTYNKIESGDQNKYPINGNILTIKSFYEPDYDVQLVLKNNDAIVKEVTFRLERFAFGGNAGSLLLVDSQGINCKDEHQQANCTSDDNIWVSTDYRGIVDTFYTASNATPINISNVFSIFDINNVAVGVEEHDITVYPRDESFHPWAVAIFYSGDTVIGTKSYDLGELVKTDGYTDEAIPASEVNGVLALDDQYPDVKYDNYDPSNYGAFGFNADHAISVNKIKWFDERAYKEGIIEYRILLATKQTIKENQITKIALFLTNGELKDDDEHFPELTYGVGEGKIFRIDNTTFDEELGYGGN